MRFRVSVQAAEDLLHAMRCGKASCGEVTVASENPSRLWKLSLVPDGVHAACEIDLPQLVAFDFPLLLVLLKRILPQYRPAMMVKWTENTGYEDFAPFVHLVDPEGPTTLSFGFDPDDLVKDVEVVLGEIVSMVSAHAPCCTRCGQPLTIAVPKEMPSEVDFDVALDVVEILPSERTLHRRLMERRAHPRPQPDPYPIKLPGRVRYAHRTCPTEAQARA